MSLWGLAGSLCLLVDSALFLRKKCLLGKQTKNKHHRQKFFKVHVKRAIRNVKWCTNYCAGWESWRGGLLKSLNCSVNSRGRLFRKHLRLTGRYKVDACIFIALQHVLQLLRGVNSGTIFRWVGEEYKINKFKLFQFWISEMQF